MKVQKVYDLLAKIENDGGKYDTETMRILKFIYHDVYKKIDDMIQSYEEELDDDELVGRLKLERMQLEYFLDKPDSSILTYFFEMIGDNKKNFIDTFLKICTRYFRIIDNGCYEKKDFDPVTLTFNLYFMLKAYHEYKDDYISFSTFLNSFNFFIEKGKLLSSSKYDYHDLCLTQKKNIIDFFIENKVLLVSTKIKDFFDKLIEKICIYGCEIDYDDEFDFNGNISLNLYLLKQLSVSYNKYKDSPLFSQKSFEIICGDILSRFSDSDDTFYYSPILFLGDRYQYILDAYDKYLDDDDYFGEVIEVLEMFDSGLFDYLNEINSDGKDSFISCMEMVFDSDCLFEMKKKLGCLLEATLSFKDNEIEKSLSLVKKLSTDSFKRVIYYKKVALRDDCINMAEKPTLIIDRMVEAYKNTFGDVIHDFEFIENAYCSKDSIFAVECEVVDSVVHAIITKRINDTEKKLLELEERRKQLELEMIDSVKPVKAELKSVTEVRLCAAEQQPKVGKGYSKIKSLFGRSKGYKGD